MTHFNNWGSFSTETIIIEGGKGMVSIDYYVGAENTAFIHDLSVVEEARSKGLGRQLMQLAIEAAKQRGYNAVELNYNSKVTPHWVGDWYSRIGFDDMKIGSQNVLLHKDI